MSRISIKSNNCTCANIFFICAKCDFRINRFPCEGSEVVDVIATWLFVLIPNKIEEQTEYKRAVNKIVKYELIMFDLYKDENSFNPTPKVVNDSKMHQYT